MNNEVPISLSNRHIHLSKEMIDALFGEKGLTIRKYLTKAKTEYAAEETVTVKGPKGSINKVRVLGPARSYNQVELLKADTFILGVDAPLRESGHLEGAADLTIVYNGKEYPLNGSGILALRHIHMDSELMDALGIQEKQMVSVEVDGERGLVFKNVLVRRSRSKESVMHVDMEEGNAAGLKNGMLGRVIV